MDLRPVCGEGRGVNQKLWAGLGGVALLLVALLGRFHVVPGSSGGAALLWRVDRWTGRVEMVAPASSDFGWRLVRERNP